MYINMFMYLYTHIYNIYWNTTVFENTQVVLLNLYKEDGESAYQVDVQRLTDDNLHRYTDSRRVTFPPSSSYTINKGPERVIKQSVLISLGESYIY